MNRWKRIIPCMMAVAMMAASPMTSVAGNLSDYDAETQERLRDNKLEYDELGALIAVYNPDLKNKGGETFNDTVAEWNLALEEIAGNIEKLESQAADMKAAGNMVGYQTYKGLASQMRDNLYKSMKSKRDNMISQTGTRQLRAGEYQLTGVAQMLMANNQALMVNREMALKAQELAEAAYQSTQTQLSLNMGTEADLLTAKKAVDQAADGLAQIDAGLTQIRQTLFMMTGWNYDSSPEIGVVPAVDTRQVASINLEEDKVKAVGNNMDLISSRKSDKARGTTASRQVYNRNTSEAEQKVCIALEQLYNTMQQKRIESEAANAAFASAQSAKHAADSKYQMNMLGRLEYLQAEVAYLSQKAAKEAADMELVNAYNDYQWGVKGILTIDS